MSSIVSSLARRLSRVRRLHTYRTVFPQSVAEHSYNTAMLLVVLATAASSSGVTVDLGYLLLRALFHDLPEPLTGDIPYPIKQRMKEKIDFDELEHSVLIRAGLHLEGAQKADAEAAKKKLEEDLFHLADMLELFLTCLEEAENGNSELPDVYEKSLSIAVSRYQALPPSIRLALTNSAEIRTLLSQRSVVDESIGN